MMVYSAILTFYWPQSARVRAYLVKIFFQEGSRNLKMSIFGPKNVGKIQSKIGTPKIHTPKIDTPKIATFSSFEHTQNVSIFGEGLY